MDKKLKAIYKMRTWKPDKKLLDEAFNNIFKKTNYNWWKKESKTKSNYKALNSYVKKMLDN